MSEPTRPAVDPKLLEILVCPEDHSPLHLADAEIVAKLNADIACGAVRDRSGNLVKESVDALLVRADGRWAYPIVRGLPILMIDEALAL